MRSIFVIFILFSFIQLYSQVGKKEYIETTGFNCVQNVSRKFFQAAAKGNKEEINKFRKIIINNCVEGKYISSHKFKSINKKIVYTDSIVKPIFIWVTNFYCNTCINEIKIINELCRIYADNVEFFVFFGDKRNNVKKLASKYDSRIHLIPIEKKIGKYNDILYFDKFKHSYIFPAAYVINIDKKIVKHYLGFLNRFGEGTEKKIFENTLKEYSKPLEELIN
jgi:thiol-disulfide isomerase/thioredoxin